MSLVEAANNQHTPAALLFRQLEAIDAWNTARRQREHMLLTGPTSREGRLDAARRLEVLRHAHNAVLARVESFLDRQPIPLPTKVGLRAVIAHRHGWFIDKLSQELALSGVAVIAATDNGAEALGLTVAEQPDLLVTGDALLMMPAAELLGEASLFAASTLRAAQVARGDGVGRLLDAGAHSAFARQVPPREMARDLVAQVAVRS